MIVLKILVALIKCINFILNKMGMTMSVNIHKVPKNYLTDRGMAQSYKNDEGNDVTFYTQQDSIITYFY